MKNIILVFYTLFIYGINVFAQVDTMVVYDVRTQEINLINPPTIDSIEVFDHTVWNFGQHPGQIGLSLSPPVITPPNSGFTDLEPAQSIYNITDYPIRTAVKLFKFVNDTLAQCCSGIMVARNLVLTSAHCIFYNFDTSGIRTFSDSILAIPAFDNGVEQPQFSSSISTKYYIPKTWHDNEAWDDIALIELQDSIGLITGWIGMAFCEDSSFFQTNVFHKLSYPAAVDPFDSTRIFSGDTLYYNYGTLDLIQDNYLGYNLSGIPGQSGSSLFYTDNMVYYTFGTLSWASQSKHYRINRNTFYVIKNILETYLTSIENIEKNLPSTNILERNYPNPFNYSTIISYLIVQPDFVELNIYDVLGCIVRKLINEEKSTGRHYAFWDGRDKNDRSVSSGIYYYTLKVGKNSLISKRMLFLK